MTWAAKTPEQCLAGKAGGATSVGLSAWEWPGRGSWKRGISQANSGTNLGSSGQGLCEVKAGQEGADIKRKRRLWLAAELPVCPCLSSLHHELRKGSSNDLLEGGDSFFPPLLWATSICCQ